MFFYILIFIFGTIIGSFLNVVILRIRSGEKITTSRSHCSNCKHELVVADLVPVFSFIFLGGKCRYCKQKISWQYILLELSTGLIFSLVTYAIIGRLGFDILFLNSHIFLFWVRNLIFVCFLIIIFVYDLRWYLILDRFTVPAMFVAVVLNLWLSYLGWHDLNWLSLVIASIVGGGFFYLQFVYSKGKWIGGGDIRMGVVMGLMLGWPLVIVGLFFSYIIGAIFSIILVLAKRKKLKSQLPFGTFLAVGTLVALLWGGEIINWYLSLF